MTAVALAGVAVGIAVTSLAISAHGRHLARARLTELRAELELERAAARELSAQLARRGSSS